MSRTMEVTSLSCSLLYSWALKAKYTFLLNLREKLLVLFDGLQSPNIDNLEKKLDLTINFLEFALSQIDNKLNARDN